MCNISVQLLVLLGIYFIWPWTLTLFNLILLGPSTRSYNTNKKLVNGFKNRLDLIEKYKTKNNLHIDIRVFVVCIVLNWCNYKSSGGGLYL